MFSKMRTMRSTAHFSDNVERLKQEIETADAILIGAGAGLSTAAGFAYDGARFRENFSAFEEKYGFHDMYTGGFYPYQTPEEYWAWWAKHILVNRYDCPVGKVYTALLALVRDRDCFVLTTNVDHQFQRAGFDKKRLFYTQGDYGLWQCAAACHDKTYDNEKAVRKMVAATKDLKIPTALVPRCPVCGGPMTMHLRCDDRFVQDARWYRAAACYTDFVRRHKGLHVLFLELGVGMNTPAIIKYPFWQMTAENSKAVYACVNRGQAFCPSAIADRSLCLDADIADVLARLT